MTLLYEKKNKQRKNSDNMSVKEKFRVKIKKLRIIKTKENFTRGKYQYF